ncbi:two-component system response regulator RppA [Anthocerotibacter panamensis]|uniref:two-component system response regulator RppA n=1 Tax=Anthocerotibacter panamensis TaxID=2857077 RepID=UPI001C404439|nr:two-component system response regulator RppA [Anthocerotibacter panamensis]
MIIEKLRSAVVHLLLVEDEEELALPLQVALTREGHRVDLAHDGEAAQALFTAHSYDLLVLDWMLPGLSGLELCQRLRWGGARLPILILTARDRVDDRVQGLDAGADDYLVKPFELKELLARVRALARRPQERNSPSERLGYADLVLDLTGKLAFRQGQPIELSAKEFQLLHYFCQHQGEVVSHEAIYNHLWPTEQAPNSNVVAAQVKLLRRKVDRDFDPPLIHTVYGLGYRFGA